MPKGRAMTAHKARKLNPTKGGTMQQTFTLNLALPVELREAKEATGLTWRQVILCGLSMIAIPQEKPRAIDKALEKVDVPQEGDKVPVRPLNN